MSAKKKQVVEIQGELDDITECPICTETYKEPKILPCIHTFCLICIKETGLKTNKSSGDKMPCPVCRTEFTVPEKGFVGLQRNFFMERLIEMKNILNPSSESVLCDACQDDSDLGGEVDIPSAAMYCADCNQRMCEECCKNHRKYKATKNHRMLQLSGAQINIPALVKPYVCDKHEDNPLVIYCTDCQEAICALCFFGGHKTHETSPVVNVSSDFRRVIKENSDSMLSIILDLKNKVMEEDNGKVVFARKVAAVESEIKATRQNLQECIEKHCDALLQQLNSIKQENNKKSESQLCDLETVLASLVSYQAYCTQVTTIGSDVDICREVYNLNRRAADLNEHYELLSLEPFPNIWLKKPEFHNVFLRAGNNIIGKIEEHGEDITPEVENIHVRSFSDKMSSFVDEFFDILGKASVGEKDDVHQSTAEADDGKNEDNEDKERKRNTLFEEFENTVRDEKKVWTTCDVKLSDKLQHLKIRISDLVETNEKLKNESKFQQERISNLEEVINSTDHETEVMKLDEQIVDLKRQITLLSTIAYNGDKPKEMKKNSQLSSELTFHQTISTVDLPNETEYRVTGLAIIDNELFVTSASNVVEVNDLRTLKFKRRWRDQGIQKVVDMKSSVDNKCLYLLCDYRTRSCDSYKARLLKCNTKGIVVRQWEPDVGLWWGLGYSQISVTDKSNVLVTNGYDDKFTEYSPDGDVIRVISLKWESGIQNLMHAIKLTSDHFLICHGKGQDSLHRVCIVDIDGNVLKYFGDIRQTDKLNNPIYLEVAADGNFLVADHLNQRLLLFDSCLEFIKKLTLYNPGDNGYVIEKRPQKMLLDEANGRMFVAEQILKGEPKTRYSDRLSVFTFPMQ